MKKLPWLIACLLICVSLSSQTNQQTITRLLKENIKISRQNRFALFTNLFIDAPYQGGPLGEGPDGKYDCDPLWRFDCFDCTTLVETVLALAGADSFDLFEKRIKSIRYKKGRVSFVTRNHFTSIDWNPNNETAGFVRDVTVQIGGKNILHVSVVIDKANWYSNMKLSQIQGIKANIIKKGILLRSLHRKGRKFAPQVASIAAIPFDKIHDNKAFRKQFMENLPDRGVINFVRPGWDIKHYTGTDLLVSHQGLILKEENEIFLIHASSIQGKVVKIPLLQHIDNLHNQGKNWCVNIMMIVE